MKILDNIKKNTILLLIITLVVLYIVLRDDFNSIINAFQQIDIKYILLALIFYILSISIRGYVNYLIVNDKEKISVKEAIKHNVITQFFNGVTPFSTGGQPMEIYMLTEHNISVAKATNQTIQSFIFYQVALVICGIVAVICNYTLHIFPKVEILQHLVLLGFAINVAVVIVLLLISYSKKVTLKLSNIAYKIAKKFNNKIEKAEFNNTFMEYYNGFKEMKKRKGLMIGGVLLNITSLLCLYSIPLFILYSMNNFVSLNVINTLISSAYVFVIGAFVPIPGATGGIEYGFTQFFGNFVGIKQISALLLLWRFMTYYFGVIIGAIIFNLEKKVKK